MFKLTLAALLLLIVSFLQTNAFAETGINCKFKEGEIAGVKSLQLSQDALIINSAVSIPLEKLRVKCANMGRQIRLEGEGLGLQVILKSCSNEAQMEGHIIDPANNAQALVQCDEDI